MGDRYFNILKQGKSYDPEGMYIRLWCPEIASLPTECLLNAALINEGIRTKYGITTTDYPKPCCKLMHTAFKGVIKVVMVEVEATEMRREVGTPGNEIEKRKMHTSKDMV